NPTTSRPPWSAQPGAYSKTSPLNPPPPAVWQEGHGAEVANLDRGRHTESLDPAPIEVSMKTHLLRNVLTFLRKEDGPTAVEYAVMLALIVVVCIAAITTLGKNANATFSNVALNTGAS